MDSRVILKRAQDPGDLKLPELKKLRRIKPTLTASGRTEHKATVTLIIPTFFNAELKNESLRLALKGLARSKTIREIIIVCSDGVKRRDLQLPRLANHQRLRICRAKPGQRGGSRNIGAALARSEYLLFLDDDMLLRDWRSVDVILSALISGRYDCALFPRRQYARFPLLYRPSALSAVVRGWRLSSLSPGIHDPLVDGTYDLPMLFCFPGCFMLIERGAFKRLRGFNERYRGWGFEDTEFGLRALRRLRVMNLFHRAEPLLHIDHPVSPYKSEEHRANYRRFFGSDKSVDMHRFCRTVLLRPDLERQEETFLPPAIHTEVFAAVAAAGVPLDPRDLESWAASVAEKRLHALLHPRPEFIVLHGSRATGRASTNSDFDVLALYRGTIQDFFVTRGEPRVEIECADLELFRAIAEHPCQVGLHGVMELAKIAQARLLWGPAAAWNRWRSQVLRRAVKNGLLYWRVLSIGLRLHRSKYGVMLDRFSGSLGAVLAAAQVRDSAHVVFGMTEDAFASETVAQLDSAIPTWRQQISRNQPLFNPQPPEIWSALHVLAAHDQAPPSHPVRPTLATDLRVM